MALNFPNNPSVNDTVELAGKTFQYDGVKWRMVYVVTPTPPTEQALAPTITKVSETETSITFTLKNNDALTATLVYRYSSLTGDGESISLATNTTSSNITLSGITFPGTLFVTANATGKVKSSVVEAEYTGPIFTAATGGTTLEYDSGGKRFKSHTFTSNGNFVVSTVGDNIDDRNKADYLVIAGGGGGSISGGNGGGGGGSGGYRTTFGTQGGNGTLDSKVIVTATSHGVTVGAGSVGMDDSDRQEVQGNPSSVFNITSIGGGSGVQGGGDGVDVEGDGGSGGGASGTSISLPGGLGTTNQGFNGGDGFGAGSGNRAGGGGGGAGQAGQNAAFQKGGDGGDGLSSIIRTGSSEFRGGGGGGGHGAGGSESPATGGLGGGGNGSKQLNSTLEGSNGEANTGGGGGGGTSNNNSGFGYSGGSGIVIIRYEIAPN